MSAVRWIIACAGALGVAATLATEPPMGTWSQGQHEYQKRCASCHGASGRGDGTVANQLSKAPPDLTTYARRNGGAFPTELAWQRIDGRPLGFDSDREMPVWGRDLRHEALAHPYFRREPEAYVAWQIDAVVSHLKTMQSP